MNLLTKTLANYIITSFIVFLLGGLVFFNVIKRTFYQQIDKEILTEKTIIEEEIQHNEEIPDYSTRFNHEIEVILYRHPVKPIFILKDTALYDTASHENDFYRYLKIADNKNKKGYSIAILRPLSGRHLLFQSVVDTMLIMFLATMFLSILINYIVSRKLWLPFHDTIKTISNYDINDKVLMTFPKTNIKEFDKLNEVINTMSKKIRSDFFNLKEFTENASHEIQTPLAIIKSKLEILMQSENLDKQQIELIQAINQTVTRISKLNSGLLLITKIDNNQYSELQPIKINTIIDNAISNFDEFIKNKNLNVTVNYSVQRSLNLNPILADLLINNLINNAIKHNYDGGFINIELDFDKLVISNSGEPLANAPNEFFQRFKKADKDSDSLGLGLAIVKKICSFHKIDIFYSHEKGTHTITIRF